ncbi:MAG: gliding motility lipoprotein GldB [Fulvivirga sp.]|uniref:gliding motility lipoprotein GldB n=1 Tax=Fulvivirga sp. TaxID=1931237 RepID=UPI0032EE11B5
MNRNLWLVSALIGLFLGSCDSNDKGECVFQPSLNETVSIEIEQLEDVLLDIQSKDSLVRFLNDHPIITNYFLRRSSYPNDSIMMETLLRKYANPHIDTLQMEIDRVFGDLSQLKEDLNTAFSHLKYYYPDARIPKVKTVATGLDFDLYVSDSLIVIGLDYYLGQGGKYRPINMYQYILKRYAPEYIVPSIMLLNGIAPEYNGTSVKDKTILADMISYGKSFYFAKHMMPCTPDSVIIWYTNKEIVGSRKNIDIIWTHFVENELLYETNHMVKKKYIDDRPKTYEIGDEAPGRIGTWLGWQIVRKYMEEHPDVTLAEMMLMESPQQLFKESKFKPDKGGIF